MVAFSAGAAGLFGLQACRDVESEKGNPVNALILWSLGLLLAGGRAVVPLAGSRLSSNLRRFAHEIGISNYFRRILWGWIAPNKE